MQSRLVILCCLTIATLFVLYSWSEQLPPFNNKTSSDARPTGSKAGKKILSKQKTSKGPKYNFMVAGVQKGGTTELFHFLRRHPYVQVTKRKELHFFDNETIDWKAPDYTAYESHPLHGTPSAAVGECTPIYIYWPNTMERIQRYNPKIKLILIFRHPVERAFSQWKMECRHRVETEPFSWAIREGRQRLRERGPKSNLYRLSFSYVERGYYGQQLERLLRLFPRKQLLFLLSDDFRHSSTKIIRRISKFLEVPAPEKRIRRPKIKESSRGSDEPVLNATDAAYLQSLYNDDLKLFAKLSGLNITSWFR